MLKKMRRLLVVVLALSMVLSLTACSKKSISADDFIEIMEDEYDCEIVEIELSGTGRGREAVINARSTDDNFFVTYEYLEELRPAEMNFDSQVRMYENMKKSDDFDGTIKKSGSGNFEKLIIKGDVTFMGSDSEDEVYKVIIRSGKMIITATIYDTGKKAVRIIDGVIETLGY